MTTGSSAISWLIDYSAHVLVIGALVAVSVEAAVRYRRTRRIITLGMGTSVAAGAAYFVAKLVVSKILMFGVALWLWENHRLFDFDNTTVAAFVALFVLRDFVYYWVHRAEHGVRVLWASHMVHHSSTEFTFVTAVRLPWTEALYKPVIYLWSPLVGFHPLLAAAMGALVLLAGQIQHTEIGRRKTILDLVLVTPSAHRVHHGSNQIYLDKNFGSILIVWDRIFGTYQPETESVRYGLTGAKVVNGPMDALKGGYPELFADARAATHTAGRVRTFVAAP